MHLAESWFTSETLDGLIGTEIELAEPTANNGQYGIVAGYLTTPSGAARLD